MCTCVQAYMLTCLHAYMRTRLHACAYMFARLYALICLDTTVFLHAYVLTCLLATPCSPTLTHIDNHLTPCDTYLITISGRTSSTGVRHTFRFLVFAFWFSILPLVFDSVFFQIFPALPTVPRGPGVPSQAPKLQNFNFLTYTCEPSVTGQGFLGAIIPCTAGNRISRGEPPTSAWNYSLLPTSATPNIEEYLKLVTDVDNSCATLTYSSIRTAGNGITREKTQPQLAANE